MIDLQARPIEAAALGSAAGLLGPDTLDELREGALFAPGCFALGVYENSTLKGALAGRGADGGVFELLEMNYNRAIRPEAGEALLRAFERLARLRGAARLACAFSAPAGELAAFAQPFAAARWQPPERLSTLLYIETPTRDLHKRTKTYETDCEIVPLLSLPLETTLRYLAGHDERCDFTRLGELVPEISLACVQNGELLGYIAFAPGKTAVEAVRLEMPADKAAGGLLINRVAAAYSALGLDAMILRADSEYGEHVSRALFGDKIKTEELFLRTEKKLGEDAQ